MTFCLPLPLALLLLHRNMEKRNRLCELESSMHVSKAELAPARAAPAPAPASPAPSFVPGMAPAFA